MSESLGVYMSESSTSESLHVFQCLRDHLFSHHIATILNLI